MLTTHLNTSLSSLCVMDVFFFFQALVQCEHVLAELARQRERLEKELALEQGKIAQARDAARSESKKEKEELAQMVNTFSRVTDLNTFIRFLHKAFKYEQWRARANHKETCFFPSCGKMNSDMNLD